jgi:putative NADH-flavin reductase
MVHSIIVFGGQGRTGSEVVVQALKAGHKVSVFTYNNNGSLRKNHNLTIVEGDARNINDVTNAIAGHDIVINIIAPKMGDSKNYDISLIATQNIINGMKANDISRYFGQCGAWATEDLSDASLFMRLGFKFFISLKRIYHFKKLEDTVVKKSGLNWTIVRAALLTNGPLEWPIRSFTNGYKCRFYEIPRISRKSVAKYYIENIDNPDLVNKCPVVMK